MMFSLSFAVFLLITFGINGQTNDINIFRPNNNVEKGYPFGKLRLAEGGQNEELISSIDTEKLQVNQDQPSSVQPLPSPCIGSSSSTKLAYPGDKTKYILCRDEFHYEIFTCPNGGEYNEQTTSCDLIIPMNDKCEQEKPCLNDGQCTVLANSTFKCTCRQDWTGERCETPMNSCVKKPCGPNAECRSLKTTDYEQDYVCVCHASRGYGLTCQEVVPNPCLTTGEQFFSYAFSQRAYIQCNGELIYFQPCGPSLYWNQEEKFCDRKRPPKIDLPALLKKFASNINENQQESINKEMTATTTVQTEQQNSGLQNEMFFGFVPARVANRQQLLGNMNNQQDGFGQNVNENLQQTRELSNQLSQPVASSQIRQNFMSRTQQWPNQQTESTIRQTPTIQSGRNQPWSQNTQQQWTPTLTGASWIDSSNGQSQMQQDNQQQQNTSQQTQASGGQQGLNQIPDTKTQNTQRFLSQSWQGSQMPQSQPQFQGQNQQNFLETTAGAQNIHSAQGFQNPNVQGQQPSWQNIPSSQFSGTQSQQPVDFNSQNTQHFGSQTQPWQGSQTIQTQPQWPNQNQQSFSGSSGAAQSSVPSQGFQNPNLQGQQPSWQNIPSSQFPGSQLPQSGGFNTQNNQNLASQPWQGTQTVQSQPQWQNQNQQSFLGSSAAGQSSVSSQGFQNPNVQGQQPSWQNIPSAQFGGTQSQQPVDFNSQNTQHFGSQTQPWQGSQTIQTQPQWPNQNQQSFSGSSAAAQGLVPSQGFQNPNAQGQQPSWQNMPSSQFPGSQLPQSGGFNTQNNQNLLSQPWLRSQSSGNQTQLSSSTPASIPMTNKTRLNSELQQTNQLARDQSNLPQQQNQVFGSQQWLNQIPDTKTQNNQRFVSQPQFQDQNQQSFVETSTVAQNMNLFQGFQNPNIQGQDQSWQNRPNTQQIQNQPIKSQSNQVVSFEAKPWLEILRQKQNSLKLNPSSEIQNTQFGLNQQQKSLPIQNSFQQKQSWPNNQQFQLQGNQLTDSDDLQIQTTENFAFRPVMTSQNQPWSQTGQLTDTTTDQRKTLDSMPSLSSGSWKSRS